MATAGKSAASQVNWRVFSGAAIVIVAFTIWAAAAENSYDILEATFVWIGGNLGWYFIATATLVVLFVLVVAVTKVGRTKIGPDHSKPRFSMFTWASMLFAAGIGVDLMFFSVVGPAANLRVAPGTDSGSMEAAENAALWTMFHYGIPGWAMYALVGMAFGLFAYRYHLPLSIRSALYPIIGKRAQGRTGDAIEISAIIGTVFGIATSLGIGVVFLSFGLNYVFGIESGFGVQTALIVLAAIVVTISTVSGVDKGIRRLSELNVLVAILLMLYVLFSGNTVNLLDALVTNLGSFVAQFPGMLTETFPYDSSQEWLDEQWLEYWTIFFWAWWMAWAPFVGLFLARISRGRTLRQFISGVLIVPFGFIAIWISIFGNATVFRILGGDEDFALAAEDFEGSGYFELISQYPGATFAIAVSVLVGLLFYITSADSGALVLANFTSKTLDSTSDGPPWLRVVWSVIIGALTLVMLSLDGIYTLQMSTVIIGLPLSIVLYLLMLGIWRALRLERHSAQSKTMSRTTALSERTIDPSAQGREHWQRRLARRMQFPQDSEVAGFITKTAIPAVEEVAEELSKQGADVHCERGIISDSSSEVEIPHVDLQVVFPDHAKFKYQIYPVAYSVPRFASNLRSAGSDYWQVEVFSASGSSGYDVFGYTQEQIIADVLDAYDQHLTMLTLTEGGPTTATLTAGKIPDDWDYDRTTDHEKSTRDDAS